MRRWRSWGRQSITGAAPDGQRRHIPILGGTFEGPLLRGEILAGGADWQVTRSDGVLVLDAIYAMRTDDGAVIQVRNRGMRSGPPEAMAALARGERVDPTSIYFRAAPALHCAGRTAMTGSTARSSCARANAGRTGSGCGSGRWSKRRQVPCIVARDAFLHPRDLLGRRFGLRRLPRAIIHAVDRAARLVAADRPALLRRSLGDPIGKAIAAEAGEPHQVDILRVLAMAQMIDQAAEGGGRDGIVDGSVIDFLQLRAPARSPAPRRAGSAGRATGSARRSAG